MYSIPFILDSFGIVVSFSGSLLFTVGFFLHLYCIVYWQFNMQFIWYFYIQYMSVTCIMDSE